MFETISDRFTKLRRQLAGRGVLSQKEIDDAIREIRLLLLEADVNLAVVNEFARELRTALRLEELARTVKPGDLATIVLHRELTKLLGGKPQRLVMSSDLTIVALMGLQGAGKTTTAAKLAYRFRDYNPLLVACDAKRPAASEQLKLLAERIGADFFPAGRDVIETCQGALAAARGRSEGGVQVRAASNRLVILDTAGRLHTSSDLMSELSAIKCEFKPHYSLLVVDGMIGQDAVVQAEEFNSRIGISGVIVSKLDGDARGGAVVSIKKVSGAPVYYVGTGEKPPDLEEFYPDRMAARIMGLGDVASLVERAASRPGAVDRQELARKLSQGRFDLQDFLAQIEDLNSLGGLPKLLGMIPGMQGMDISEREIIQARAIVQSMTKSERAEPEIIDGSRRRRIASGSGTTVEAVNRLLREFRQAREMMKVLGGEGMLGVRHVIRPTLRRRR
ncbi:MAG: signal recognition particle receptor subunit alpha [candidate division WOR-3 bacterium]